MVLPAMKYHLHVCMGVAEMCEVEVKLHIMHTTFITIQSCDSQQDEALVKGAQTFQTLFGRYFQENMVVSVCVCVCVCE